MNFPPPFAPLNVRFTRSFRHCFKLTGLFFLLMTYPSMAESTDESTLLPDITVTGQSRSTRTENRDSYTTSSMRTTTGLALSPKETPQSVSVITKTQLDDQNISRIEDALKTTTGVNVFRDNNRFRFQSRGFYINRIEEDGVAVTVAGSMLNTNSDPHSQTDLAVYDHIEVVRGATGLTQGVGEPGGTINAVRKRPTSKMQTSFDASVDRFGMVRGVLDTSGSINKTQTIRGRLVAVGERSNSFKDHVDGNKQVLYGVLDADVGDNTKLTAGALWQNEQSTPDRYGFPMLENGSDTGLPSKSFLGASWNIEKARKLNLFAEAEHYFNDEWKLTGKVDYIHSDYITEWAALGNSSRTFSGVPLDGTYAVSGRSTRMDNSGTQIGFQANLTGQYRLFGRKHDVFTTLDHSREKLYARWRQHTEEGKHNIYTFDGSIPYPDFESGPYRFHEVDNYTLTTQGLALGTRFHVTDKLHLIAGTRYTRWISDYHEAWSSRGGTTNYESNYKTRNRFIPYAGLSYDLNHQHSLYASYTQIFRPHLGARDIEGKDLAPMVGTNLELGWKSDWLGKNRLNTSLAFFQIIQKNRSVSSTDRSPITGRYYSIPTGRVISHGFDAEISGNLTEDWKLFAGYTFNTSKYRETEGSQIYYQAGTNFNSWTPRHMFRLYTSYRLPFLARKMTIGGGVSVQSKTNNLYLSLEQGGYAIWNANIQYEISKNAKLSLIGTNLTNKRYYENNRVRTRGINNFLGEPLNVAMKFTYHF